MVESMLMAIKHDDTMEGGMTNESKNQAMRVTGGRRAESGCFALRCAALRPYRALAGFELLAPLPATTRERDASRACTTFTAFSSKKLMTTHRAVHGTAWHDMADADAYSALERAHCYSAA